MNTRDLLQIFTRTHNKLKRGIHFLYVTCIAPISPDEDKARHEFILNVILASSIIATGLLNGSLIASWILVGNSYRGINILLFSAIVIIFGILLYFSRQGHFYRAAYILITIYYLSSTYGIATWGVELPLAALGYVVTIIISSILINTRFAFFVTLLIAVTLLIFGYLQVQSWIEVQLYWKYEYISLKDPLQLSCILILIMTASWLSNREIERSLKRARTSEQELKKERDMLEIKVEERTKELKHMQAEKVAHLYRFAEFGRLSSGLFHDLMRPLTLVIGHVENLENHREDLPLMRSDLTKAVASSRRMGELLSSIKKQIRTDIVEQEFAPHKEIQEAVDILAYTAREANVSFVLHLNENIITYGNPLKFHQIAINLIANAIDTCMQAAKENMRIKVHLTQKGTMIHLTISDDGCGIDPAIQDKIFDPFFTTKHTVGMGLGLSTTKDIIEKDFNGTIAVQSVLGKGTVFTVIFPIRHTS